MQRQSLTLTALLTILFAFFTAAADASSPVVAIRVEAKLSSIQQFVAADSPTDVHAHGGGNDAGVEFLMEDTGDGRVHFRSIHGTYLWAVNGGGGDVLADRTTPANWGSFTVVDVGGGKVMIS